MSFLVVYCVATILYNIINLCFVVVIVGIDTILKSLGKSTNVRIVLFILHCVNRHFE